MITRILSFLCVLAVSSTASVITGGHIPVTKNTDGQSDADQWHVELWSAEGNYSVNFTEEGITSSPGCSLIATLGCPQGTAMRITAFSLDLNYGAAGTATIRGVAYPHLFFGAGTTDPDAPHTRLSLTTERFTVTGPGLLTVRFAMNGRLEAQVEPGERFLLSEDIFGVGNAQVWIEARGNNLYPSRISYSFTPVPEPGTWTLALPAVAAVCVKLWRTRNNRGLCRVRWALACHVDVKEP